MTATVSIIISASGGEHLLRCLEALKGYLPAAEIILAGNVPVGLKDRLPSGILHEPGPFAGQSAAFNRGAGRAHGSLLLFLHEDVLLPPGTLEILREELLSAPEAAAIGPLSNRSRNISFQMVRASYGSYGELLQFCRRLSTQGGHISTIWLDSLCLLIRQEDFSAVGGFDEFFPSHGAEDMDLSLRLLERGRKLLITPRAYVHHEPKSAVLPGEEENLRRFRERWRFSSEYSLNARNDLLPWLEGLPEEARILEIGCACGPTLLKAGDRFPHAKLYGVELEEGPARIAAHFAEVSACNIEELSRPDWTDFFDCIICGDVIEHLLRPQRALENIYRYLKPGGRLLLGIPNVMHISIFEHLLHGRFPYADSGLLDKTHTKFFTRTEIWKMLEEARFRVEDCDSLVVPMTSHQQELLAALTPLLAPGVSPDELKSYQIHVKAVK